MRNQPKFIPLSSIVMVAMVILFVVFVYRSLFSIDSLKRNVEDISIDSQTLQHSSSNANEKLAHHNHVSEETSLRGSSSITLVESGQDAEHNQGKCDFNLWNINKEKMDKLLNDKSLDDEVYYKAIYDEQKRICGPLCTFDDDSKIHHYPNDKKLVKYHLRTKITCCNLFTTPIFDEPAVRWPVEFIPKAMEKDFMLGGKVRVDKSIWRDRVSGLNVTVTGDITTTLTPKWNKEKIQYYIDEAKKGTFMGAYYNAGPIVYEAAKFANFTGKHILVIGSQKPWVEAALLAAGVKKITTLEYMRIKTDHPQIETIMPLEFNEKYSRGELRNAFDGAMTYSSIEHSGLGRYGDLMNPWGDVIAIAKVWCTIKDGGLIAVGVPDDGTNRLSFNAHRYYGPDRWPLVFTNWEVVHKIPGPNLRVVQPIMIARKHEFV